jgi:hypothetical protein
MNGRTMVDCFTRYAVVGVAAFGFVVAALADPGRLAHGVTITILPDRYIVGGQAFDDLDSLEKRVTATNFRSVVLVVCGPKATRAVKAAVHRFRQVPVQIRVPDVDEFECMSKAPLATPVRQRSGKAPFGIDDEAVERYWLDIMP